MTNQAIYSSGESERIADTKTTRYIIIILVIQTNNDIRNLYFEKGFKETQQNTKTTRYIIIILVIHTNNDIRKLYFEKGLKESQQKERPKTVKTS